MKKKFVIWLSVWLSIGCVASLGRDHTGITTQINESVDVGSYEFPTKPQVKVVPLLSQRIELDRPTRSYRRPELAALIKPVKVAKPAAAKPVAPIITAPAVAPEGAKAFIYNHESGNNPASISHNGACGLGQALPCGKLGCPLNSAGYACQDAWFTSYMLRVYGTWDHAMQMWISRAHHCRSDWCGGWW